MGVILQTQYCENSLLKKSPRLAPILAETILSVYPEANQIIFMDIFVDTELPHKHYVFGITDKNYFEGTYSLLLLGQTKNYVPFISLPWSVIFGLGLIEGKVQVRAHLDGEGEPRVFETSIFPSCFEPIFQGIESAQNSLGIKPLTRLTSVETQANQTKSQPAPVYLDTSEELMKAKQMLDAGVLTEIEFANLKKKLLGL